MKKTLVYFVSFVFNSFVLTNKKDCPHHWDSLLLSTSEYSHASQARYNNSIGMDMVTPALPGAVRLTLAPPARAGEPYQGRCAPGANVVTT
jgi:hypothetical protein